jgi:hypothetical protein
VLFFDFFILRIDDSVIGMNNAGLALSQYNFIVQHFIFTHKNAPPTKSAGRF